MPLLQILLSIVLIMVVIGVVLYLVNTYVPMEPGIKNMMNVVVLAVAAILIIIWIVQSVGGGLPDIPRVK